VIAFIRFVRIGGQAFRAKTGVKSQPKSSARLWMIRSHLLVDVPALE
jgi:hypothetical protein